MSIWGKVVGGATGLALGGPLGAILGAVAGHALDQMRSDRRGPANVESRQGAFAVATIVLAAKMAKADGRVTRDEIDAFKRIYHIPPEEAWQVGQLFDIAKREAEGFEAYARQAAELFAHNPAVLEDLLDGLFAIAMADGVMHEREIAFLERVARIFGFNAHEFERIRASHVGLDAADPYTVLGIERSVSDAKVKAAWRVLIREHHPDLLLAQGMPQESVDVANDKMAAINAAYDRVRAERGMT